MAEQSCIGLTAPYVEFVPTKHMYMHVYFVYIYIHMTYPTLLKFVRNPFRNLPEPAGPRACEGQFGAVGIVMAC